MSENGIDDKIAKLDAQIDSALKDALRTQPLGPDALARLRMVTAREWQSAARTGAHSVRARRVIRGSLAAALSIVALAACWFLWRAEDPAIFGLVARSEVGTADVRFRIIRQRTLQVGDTLRKGDTLTTRGAALITLSSGGTLRIAADTVVEITGEAQALLRRGQIYVDVPPVTSGNSSFRVVTRAGTIEHVGTEFEVLSNGQVVRLRVREGHVRLRNRTGVVFAEAGTELVANETGVVSRHSIPNYGRDWLWVAALAPDYEIEGHPLIGFLEWVSRELGRPLKFSDAHAREVAERTILHGSVRGREPLDALASVLATTSLSYEIRGDTIWIQSAHGA